jgi:hypothetical protein
MEFSIRHSITGRIWLHVPSLCRKQRLALRSILSRPAELYIRLYKGV